MKGKQLSLLHLPQVSTLSIETCKVFKTLQVFENQIQMPNSVMAKPLILAIFGYSILLSSLVAQNNDGKPAISIQLAKMNVVYVGVDNPITVSCEGLSSSDFQLKTDKGKLTCIGKGQYNLNVNEPGEIMLTLLASGNQKISQSFKAKRIPDPIPALGGIYTQSDTMNCARFKAQGGLSLLFENFDFDVKCEMIEYKITHIGANFVDGKIFTHAVRNKGVRFGAKALELIYAAAPEDIFIFSEIKALCAEDKTPRHLNALVIFMENYGDD